MNPAQLLAHFDRISEAPDAVPRLRRFILDLAVRGKLVEQDPNDEPASELLKRIEREKQRLLASGQIRNAGPIDRAAGELAFPLPRGWEASRMGSLARKLGAGSTPLGGKTVYQAEGVLFIRSQNVYDDGLRLSQVARVSRAVHDRMSGTHVQQGDILLNITGASIGRCALVQDGLAEANVSQHVAIIRLFVPTIRDFIHLALTAPIYQRLIDDVQVGVSRAGLSMQRLALFVMPLPPLAEQHRIVAKVDELMALCDRLQAAQTERETRRDRVVAASLDRLSEPAEDGNQPSRDHTCFHLRHLPRLTTHLEHIERLRQAILNLAVRGRLTAGWRKQHAQSDDASRIVAKLDAAHAAVGGHRRGNAAAATEGAHDLDVAGLPPSWRATELRAAVRPDRPITYGILMPGPDTPGGVPYVRVADFPNDRLNLETIRKTTKEIEERYARARLRTGDILVSIRGTVGRICVVPMELNGANITQDTARLTLQDCLSREFVIWCLRAPVTQDRMRRCAKGVAVRGVNIGDVRALQLPVPSLAEQHRIVAKVDELMALCDRLEAQLTTAQTESRRLLEALLHQALAAVA